MALPSVSPPPSPPLLPPPPLFFFYIPGALFFAGKHSPAAGGEVELFSGINGNSAWSILPECSYLLSAPLGLQFFCLCQAW